MSNPNPTSGGPPLRALAMVLIALAIVFAGLGAMSLSSSDSDAASGPDSSTTTTTAAPATTAPVSTTAAVSSSTTTGSSATTTPPKTTSASTTTPVGRAVPVRVLNNSNVAGLAARTASDLTADGWAIAEVGNYPGPNVAKTTVFYGNSAGEKEAALAIADELGATAEPRATGNGDGATGVTVVVTGN